jgi:hypothetical protein
VKEDYIYIELQIEGCFVQFVKYQIFLVKLFDLVKKHHAILNQIYDFPLFSFANKFTYHAYLEYSNYKN